MATLLRARVQAAVWGLWCSYTARTVGSPEEWLPQDSNDGNLKPITTDVPPAPEAIVEMVRCQCKGNCSSNHISCQFENLPCTDLCLCNTQCENVANMHYGFRWWQWYMWLKFPTPYIFFSAFYILLITVSGYFRLLIYDILVHLTMKPR